MPAGHKYKVFLAATRKDVGKTTTSLGLFAAMQKQFDHAAYIKPVGQKFLTVDNQNADKDSVLMKQAFGLEQSYSDMSPVTLPAGFTENYIAKPRPNEIKAKILSAYRRISAQKDFVLIEGTGHAGVGSVVDFSNAHVAKLLNVKVIIVGGGGIGRPIDEIMLNKALFDAHGVEVIGAILNKVNLEKYRKIKRVASDGLERLGVPLLGCLPYVDRLSCPAMSQVAESLQGKIISGLQAKDNLITSMVIGDRPSHDILKYFKEGTLLITPGHRDDIILAAISSSGLFNKKRSSITGIVLTCGLKPHGNIMRLLKETDLPVVLVKDDTFTAATKIGNLRVKTRPTDAEKIQDVKELFQKHVDIQRMIDLLGGKEKKT